MLDVSISGRNRRFIRRAGSPPIPLGNEHPNQKIDGGRSGACRARRHVYKPLITRSVWRSTVARSLPQINSQPIITLTSACLRRSEVTRFAPALRPARPNLPLNKGLVARPNHPGQPWADLLMGITPGSPDNAAAAAGRHVRANPSRPFGNAPRWHRALRLWGWSRFRSPRASSGPAWLTISRAAPIALGRRRRKGDSLRGHVANRSSVRSGQWRRPRFPRPGHGHCDAVAPMLSPRVNGKGTSSCKRSMARGICTASIQNSAVLSNMASATILHRRRRC